MGQRKFNLLVRSIPALVVTGSIIALSLWWTQPPRGGTFFYFLFLMVYAVIMSFFSDVIFLSGKKPIHVRLPLSVVASIHAAYVLVLILLYVIFNKLPPIYFILATVIATGIQISLSLWIFMGAKNISAQQAALDQKANAKIVRDILLSDVQNAVKSVPSLAGDAEVMRKITNLCNAVKYSAPQDTPHTMQVSSEIDASLQSLIDSVSSGNTEADSVTGQISKITALVEKRNQLLKLKQS
jgi:hypothetical protein